MKKQFSYLHTFTYLVHLELVTRLNRRYVLIDLRQCRNSMHLCVVYFKTRKSWHTKKKIIRYSENYSFFDILLQFSRIGVGDLKKKYIMTQISEYLRVSWTETRVIFPCFQSCLHFATWKKNVFHIVCILLLMPGVCQHYSRLT